MGNLATNLVVRFLTLGVIAGSSAAQTAPTKPAATELEAFINTVPSAARLRTWHDLLGSEPHMAGTVEDELNIARQVQAFTSLGLDVTTQDFWAYLCKPLDAKLAIPYPGYSVDLPLREDALPDDPYSRVTGLPVSFNAYSGDGDVTAEVVYANYGTKADFEKLRELKIDCTGKIVLARYGKNFRGYKAKFAQEAGAAGLIIYSDPDDVGYRKGVPYPEGGWANDSYIQRGSIDTLPYPGDPLTPGTPATRDAQRLDPATLELPRIPVQCVGYRAAREIMTRMTGTPLPQNLIDTWQGGIPCAYRLTSGPESKVRLMVKQRREVMKSSNVIATIPGAIWPEQKVIIGCHHDAWCHGAGDPLSGTILVFEAARSFAEAAKRGLKPARTIVFATWGAEEFGIVGSTEYCEQFGEELSKNVVAYINLDAAAMGPDFGSSASPSLKAVIDQVTALVPQARTSDGATVRKTWLGDRDEPIFGNLGGGSDHIGFYCHLGIPACSLGADGAPGTAYHSLYDNLHWYRQVVGDDYEPALMLARVVNLLAARLACDPIVPLDPARYTTDLRTHLEEMAKLARKLDVTIDLSHIQQRITEVDGLAKSVSAQLKGTEAIELDPNKLAAINHHLLALEQSWLLEKGLPDRPWFRNQFAASDPDSGYAAWMLPGLRLAVERKDEQAVVQALAPLEQSLSKLESHIQAIQSAFPSASNSP